MQIDFSEVQFESDEDNKDKIPNYTKEFMKAKQDEMQHVRKLDQYKQKKQFPKVQSRPQSAKLTPQPKQQIQKHNAYLKKKKPALVATKQVTSSSHQIHQVNSPLQKTVKFQPDHFSETTPVIGTQNPSYFDNSDAYQSDAPSKALKIQKQATQQNKHKGDIKSVTEIERLRQLGVLDWDDEEEDIDDRFIIRNLPSKYKQNNSPNQKKIDEKEVENRRKLMNKMKNKQQVDLEIILAKQEKEIEQKKQNIQQYITSNLVISNVPKENEYENEQFEKLDEELDEYQNEQFEQEEQQELKQSKQESKVEIKQEIKQESKNNKSEKSKQQIYRPRNAQERKEELEKMRKEVRESLKATNPYVKQLYDKYKDQAEKQQTMLEISNKRKEQLESAQIALQQLKEKYEQQHAIIEELKKKENYSSQIIDVLKANKEKHKQEYDETVERMLACKIILRFMRFRRDRKLFEEYKKQKLMRKLTNQYN